MSRESTRSFCKPYARNKPNGNRAFETGELYTVSPA